MTSSVRAGCTTSPGSTERESTTPSWSATSRVCARRTFAPVSCACAWRRAVRATRESAPMGAAESCCASAAFFCARDSSTARRASSSSAVAPPLLAASLVVRPRSALRALEVRLGLAEALGRHDGADASQLVDAGGGLLDGGLGLRHRCARLGVVDWDEQIARADVLPLDGADGDHEARHLRRDLHARRHPDLAARDDVLFEILFRAATVVRTSGPRERTPSTTRAIATRASTSQSAGRRRRLRMHVVPTRRPPCPARFQVIRQTGIPVDQWLGRARLGACSSGSLASCSPPRSSTSSASASSAESSSRAPRCPPSGRSRRCSRSIATPSARG